MSIRRRLTARSVAFPMLLLCGGILLVGGICLLCFGSLADTARYATGRRIVANQAEMHVGSAPANIPIVFPFAIRNLSGERYKVIGVERNCRCASNAKLPFALPPGRESQFSVELVPPASAIGSSYSTILLLYTDIPHSPIILKVSVGKVVSVDKVGAVARPRGVNRQKVNETPLGEPEVESTRMQLTEVAGAL